MPIPALAPGDRPVDLDESFELLVFVGLLVFVALLVFIGLFVLVG
jgi:hypothetical protein